MNDFSLTSKTFLANFTLLSYNPKQFWIKLNVVWVCLYIPYFNARFWDSYWNYSFSGPDVFTNCTRFYDFLLWPNPNSGGHNLNKTVNLHNLGMFAHHYFSLNYILNIPILFNYFLPCYILLFLNTIWSNQRNA